MKPEQIKDLRKKLGVSQKGLAELCGVSKRTVQNWEQNRTGISGSAKIILLQLKEGV